MKYPARDMALPALSALLVGWMFAAAACQDAVSAQESPPEDAVERYAGSRCAAMFRCECHGITSFEDEEACVSSVTSYFRSADSENRQFQSQCYRQLLEYFSSERACARDLAPACALFTGDAREGETCSSGADPLISSFDDCATGLRCTHGICKRTPDSHLVGVLEVGVSCAEDDECKSRYCGDNSLCEVPAGVGEVCGRQSACDGTELLYCEIHEGAVEGICRQRLSEGSICEPGLPSCLVGGCLDGFCSNFDSPVCGQLVVAGYVSDGE